MPIGDPSHRYAAAFRARGLTIYDPVGAGDSDLWIPTVELESILHSHLREASFAGMPLRTRAKSAKQMVCRALGYPVPASFKRSRPSFPGQRFDVYVQKSNNLQIWNEEVDAGRRYALVRIDRDDTVTSVRVVPGTAIAELDTTGTLTRKYQAAFDAGDTRAALVTATDTERVRGILRSGPPLRSIADLFAALRPLLGTALPGAAGRPARVRGAILHEQVCGALGMEEYRDRGAFPDIPSELLEVKLQMSPTIDLGLVRPDDREVIVNVPTIDFSVSPRDVRYAVFGAAPYGDHILLTSLFVVAGRDFLGRFPLIKGRIVNQKLQIPLPDGFFSP